MCIEEIIFFIHDNVILLVNFMRNNDRAIRNCLEKNTYSRDAIFSLVFSLTHSIKTWGTPGRLCTMQFTALLHAAPEINFISVYRSGTNKREAPSPYRTIPSTVS